MKLCFYDVETTSLDPLRGELIELTMIIDDDEKNILKIIHHKFKPTNFDIIDPKALETQQITLDDLKKYPDRDESFKKLINDLDDVIDKYDRGDKMYAVAHNLWFDRGFLHELFKIYNEKYNSKHYFFSYFEVEGFDTIPLLTILKFMTGLKSENMKLGTLCKAMKIKFDLSKAHSSKYDVQILRKLFYKTEALMERLMERKQ